MRFFKSLIAVVMALMVALTSMGVAVSTHTCTESGHTEIGLRPLKACCSIPTQQGFRAEPCCKVSTNHVKLPTVSRGPTNLEVAAPVFVVHFPVIDLVLPTWTEIGSPSWLLPRPPELTPLADGRDIQTAQRKFLI